MLKFFIFDCDDNLVGNPKGYATIKGASHWAKGQKMQTLLWNRFDSRQDKTKTLVWSILQLGGNVPGIANFEN